MAFRTLVKARDGADFDIGTWQRWCGAVLFLLLTKDDTFFYFYYLTFTGVKKLIYNYL